MLGHAPALDGVGVNELVLRAIHESVSYDLVQRVRLGEEEAVAARVARSVDRAQADAAEIGSVLECSWRVTFSGTEASSMASSGTATSMSSSFTAVLPPRRRTSGGADRAGRSPRRR